MSMAAPAIDVVPPELEGAPRHKLMSFDPTRPRRRLWICYSSSWMGRAKKTQKKQEKHAKKGMELGGILAPGSAQLPKRFEAGRVQPDSGVAAHRFECWPVPRVLGALSI